MNETISDQELRRRLLAFSSKVPPVTNSTRKVLLKKLEDHERTYSANQVHSPPSNDTSLMKMNVSNWNLSASEDEDQNSYLLPESKKFPNKVPEMHTEKKTPRMFDSSVNNILPREPVLQRPRSSPITETPYADQAIKRWKEKMMDQSQDKSNVSITSQFDLPSPVSSVYSQNSRRYVQPTQQRHQGSGYARNTQYIVLLVIGFFVIIFGLYFTSIQSSTVVLPPGILNALCAKKNLQGSECDTEQENVRKLYSALVTQVQDKYIKSQCDKSDIEPTMDAQTFFEYLSTHESIPQREIEELIEIFKNIAKTYSDSPIGYDTSFTINIQPNLPIMCAVKNMFTNMFYLILWLGIVGISVACIYFGICYITSKNEKHQQEVNRLIESTIDLLKQQAQCRPNENYLPIIHIRDILIAPNERQAKYKIWDEVKQYFSESESRVRSEIQQIDGEDFQVWRWVQPMSPGAVKKVWQGQAFETTEGSMNSPQPSPTSCLKIRHMFGPDSMTGVDCEIRVKDAILEKCEGIEVYHLSVDRSSQEGCVYVKCASPTEAGSAYKQLHGFWYDGKLVTVKYLRLERYHQRFPEAVNAKIPLRPSNNEKRSLQ